MELRYGLDEKPPVWHLLMYGLQWLVISIPNVLTVAMLAKIQFFDDVAMQTLYLQKLYVVVGIVMVVQALWGHRMPLVVGPAAVLIVGILSAQSAGFNAVYTAIAVCGAAVFLLSVSGLIGKIQKLFTPRIIITILGLISMTLAPVFLGLIFSEGDMVFNFAFTIIAIIATFIINDRLPGVWKSVTLVITVVAGTAVYYLWNDVPEIAGGVYSVSMDDFIIVPEFNAGAVISFLICFFALLINELGSIQSVNDMVKAGNPEKRVSRGCAVTGLGNTLSGLLGVIGPVDFSVSPGIIATTGCASRYTIIPCGIGLIVCAFCPPLIRMFTMLPDLIIGVMLMYIVVLQLAAAFNMMIDSRCVTTFNHALTIAIPLGIGLFVALLPQRVVELLPPILQPVLSNGFVIGVLIVVFLEHLVFLERKRR